MTPENIKRYEWLSSQQKWHGKRMKGNNWHARQRRWYNGQINRLPGFFTWIVSETFKRHSAAIWENVTRNNALFKRLTEKARK